MFLFEYFVLGFVWFCVLICWFLIVLLMDDLGRVKALEGELAADVERVRGEAADRVEAARKSKGNVLKKLCSAAEAEVELLVGERVKAAEDEAEKIIGDADKEVADVRKKSSGREEEAVAYVLKELGV